MIFFHTIIFARISLGHKGSVQRVDAKNVIGATTGRETAVSLMLLIMASKNAIEAVIGSVTARMQATEVEAHFIALNVSAVRHAPPVSAIHKVAAVGVESESCGELLGGHGQQRSAATPEKW